jgi:hypothetical protein
MVSSGVFEWSEWSTSALAMQIDRGLLPFCAFLKNEQVNPDTGAFSRGASAGVCSALTVPGTGRHRRGAPICSWRDIP